MKEEKIFEKNIFLFNFKIIENSKNRWGPTPKTPYKTRDTFVIAVNSTVKY